MKWLPFFQDGYIIKTCNFIKSYYQRIGPLVNQNFGKSGDVILVDYNNLSTNTTENPNSNDWEYREIIFLPLGGRGLF